MKVITIVGTRPEIIRLSRVIDALDRHTQHELVHTGQNFDYELSQVFFDELGIRPPDHFLGAAGATAAETIGLVIARADECLRRSMPEAVLLLGDTNSALAAIAAKRLKIPVFHMEAGNRCFDQRVPEEINRKIVDHVSDVNMPYSQIAREYLVREGFPPDRIIVTGSPMYEVLQHYRPLIDASGVVRELGLTEDGYYLVSAHREENVDVPTKLEGLMEILAHLAETGRRVIVSTHPRTRQRIEGAGWRPPDGVEFAKPFGFPAYVKLQLHARAVLSDSGTITEESSILDFPALNLREAHERPEGMEEAAVMMTGLSWNRVREALAVLEARPRGGSRPTRMVADYEAPGVSDKVLKIVLSYTDYVNRVVWRK